LNCRNEKKESVLNIDFSHCRIVTPRGDLLQSFCSKMKDVFPTDQPIYDALMEDGESFYPMRNYALYSGTTLLGNSGIFPFRIWKEGGWKEIYGIGAVATMPEYRRQGVASILLNHCLSLIDSRNSPSVLFTEVEEVYKPLGFNVIHQDYKALITGRILFEKPGNNFRTIKTLSENDLKSLDRIYSSSPGYTGKVMRNKNYWKFYRIMFDPYEKPEIVFFTGGEIDEGYVRFESDPDRLTITEMSCPEDRPDIIESLLSYMNNKSIQDGFPKLTIALSRDHPVWKLLTEKNIPTVPEADGVERETFMLRKAADGSESFGESLFWSLSDKF